MTGKADTDRRAMERLDAAKRDMVMTWDEIMDELIWGAYDANGPEHQLISPERRAEFLLRFPHFRDRLTLMIEQWNRPDAVLTAEELAALEPTPEQVQKTERFFYWAMRFYGKLRAVELDRDHAEALLLRCASHIDKGPATVAAASLYREIREFTDRPKLK